MKTKSKLKSAERFKPSPKCPCRKLVPGMVRTERGVGICPCYRAWKERHKPAIAPEQCYKSRQAGDAA